MLIENSENIKFNKNTEKESREESEEECSKDPKEHSDKEHSDTKHSSEASGSSASFTELLATHGTAAERFVRFHIVSKADADDILQDVYLTAYRKFHQLKSPDTFKAWLISIARSKCNDWFRSAARSMELSMDLLMERPLKLPPEQLSNCSATYGRLGKNCISASVQDTLALLKDKDKQILYLYFWKELPQAEIAAQLNVPVGTVKSRLHAAKQSFKKLYPYPPGQTSEPKPGHKITNTHTQKEDNFMKEKQTNDMLNTTDNTVNKDPVTSLAAKLPRQMPAYTITPSAEEPFSVKWEELMGWQLIPRLGEKIAWGLYDSPSGRRTEYTVMKAIGKTEVHGIEGVEIRAVQYDAEDYYRTGSVNEMERIFVAQLTDTHCRTLAESHVENGVRKCYTFLDGDAFINNWGFGENNCGNETNLSPKGLLKREGCHITGEMKPENLDIVGRYTVTINGVSYDTVCVMDIECFNDSVASEQFLDRNGRTVLWRRFNKNDWAFRHYQKTWTEMLPENERIYVNGETYVHWYDCISDYIL